MNSVSDLGCFRGAILRCPLLTVVIPILPQHTEG